MYMDNETLLNIAERNYRSEDSYDDVDEWLEEIMND